MSDITLKLLDSKIKDQQSEKPIKQKKIFSNHISNKALISKYITCNLITKQLIKNGQRN